MPFKSGTILRILPVVVLLLAALTATAQSGNSGQVRGTVSDPSGAVIPGATVHLVNAVSGLDRTVSTDATGQFEFSNIPFHPYKISVTANGFATLHQAIELRSGLEQTSSWFSRLQPPTPLSPSKRAGIWSRPTPPFTPT